MRLHWLVPPTGAAFAGLLPAFVAAAPYATLDEAARRAFPDATSFHEQLVQATSDDLKAIAATGGTAPRASTWRALAAMKGDQPLGWVIADGVIGKFEVIDYAVAIGTDGKVKAVEILAYRESHGYEVKLPAWRQQFVGKDASAPLRVGQDIANVSGATMSCTHVTEGVRHLVALAARLRESRRL
jgi:Na+-translocating ferredoxin:NAD+ oxidoreductase RnfG subunit